MSPAAPSRVAVVLGTGAMGPEIAAALADAGWRVRIAGRTPERAAGAAARAAGFARGDGPAPEACAADAAGLDGARLVVETITEDLAAKHELLRAVEPHLAADAVIATNTSSLRIADVAAPLAHPGRFAGLHFLKPAHLTGVVEVVPGPGTDAAVTAFLECLAHDMGKTPLVVRADVPGFIWNRIQFAVLRECLHMLEAGVASAEDIDAAVAAGLAPRWMAAGPLATADLGGLRTFAAVSRQLFPHLAANAEVPEALTSRAEQGGAFASWTGGDAAAEVARMRADALAEGRRFAERRRELGA
ncbi:MAG: 3-hydroxyacyl-CoA dehydrogenase family protein [Thermoleophilia bacterium]